MKRFQKILTMAVIGLAACFQADGQGKVRPWEYWKDADGYYDNQGEVLFSLIDRTLEQHPASATPSAERQLALASLDALLHDTFFDDCDAFHAFLETRVERVLSALSRPWKKGLEIFKLYNDGFIVRSATGLVVGFDLCGSHAGMTLIPEAQMSRLVRRCDMLFISHRDPDHADDQVVALAAKAGIPVYGPEDYDNEYVTKIRSEDFSRQRLSGITKGIALTVQALPGNQNTLQNNIYVVTFPDGYSVVHCGDQFNDEDTEWLSQVGDRLIDRPDVLIINPWTMDLEKTIKGFNPRCVLSGHENEMGHTIDHREALWLSQYKFDYMNLGIPGVVMTWGESFRYKRSSAFTSLFRPRED